MMRGEPHIFRRKSVDQWRQKGLPQRQGHTFPGQFGRGIGFAGLLLLVLLSACSGPTAQSGDTVLLHYRMCIRDTIKVNESNHSHHCEGSFCDSPMKIVLGNEEIYPQWEKDLLGKQAGDTSVVKILVSDLYDNPTHLDKGNILLSDTFTIGYRVIEIVRKPAPSTTSDQ